MHHNKQLECTNAPKKGDRAKPRGKGQIFLIIPPPKRGQVRNSPLFTARPTSFSGTRENGG